MEEDAFRQELATILQEGKDFLAEQSPAFVNEILLYGKISGWIGFSLSLILLLIAFYTISSLRRKSRKGILGHNDSDIFPIIIACVSSLLGVVWFMIATECLLMAYFAPRVFIIKFLTG